MKDDRLSVRVSTKLLNDFSEAANRKGTTTSELVRDYMERYVEDNREDFGALFTVGGPIPDQLRLQIVSAPRPRPGEDARLTALAEDVNGAIYRLTWAAKSDIVQDYERPLFAERIE